MASTASTSFLWQAYTTRCVTKATPIHFIDGKCHINQLKSGKSHKTCLTNHTESISHHITPLVIIALGADIQTHRHTRKHTNTQTKAISRNQARAGLSPACAWFKIWKTPLMSHYNDLVNKVWNSINFTKLVKTNFNHLLFIYTHTEAHKHAPGYPHVHTHTDKHTHTSTDDDQNNICNLT